MPQPEHERDFGWLEDMVLAAESIARFTAGLSREAFEEDEIRVLAAERQLKPLIPPDDEPDASAE